MGIQSYFIAKKIRRRLAKSAAGGADGKLDRINQIAIIVDEKSSFNDQHLKALQDLMQLDESHFDVLTIKNKRSDYNVFKGYVLHIDEVNMWGRVKSEMFESFITKDYDLMIDFVYQDTDITRLVISQVKAPLKVGYADNNHDFYNILLQVNADDVKAFNRELVKYLNILKVL